MGLSACIKERASELGFAKCGIVAAERLDHTDPRLREWLGRGFHGEMRWMARDPEKRSDPRSVFPDARSVIVLAMNYFTPHEHIEASDSGKISRYAWGDDYHDLLRERMRDLLKWIKSEEPDSNGRVSVDTAPVMEKAWAVRAGLGWIGKHSNLITKDYGSWVFLGEIFVDIELEYDDYVIEDHCGTCTACLDACPTDAIVAPYVVDSRKCISYATIELRDETLPNEIASNLNGWLYGCDICQDVCPWNRFEKPTTESAFQPRRNETSIPIVQISAMEHPEYVERFRGSAMKRTKLSGLKRNADALCSNDKLK
ncbi:MAG TPA: tRNA epoxyqueuosine(34) reductase QueG [Pyrinomonadaceae bacterium]